METEKLITLLTNIRNNPEYLEYVEELYKSREERNEIVKTCLENKLYDSLLYISKPIEINGELKIVFDIFSSDIFHLLDLYCDENDREAIKKSLFEIDFSELSRIKIKNTHAREISGYGHPVNSIEDAIYYAETACITTCIDLYNKNIPTTSNDTDGVLEDGENQNGQYFCKVGINYEALSDENKIIINELVQNGQARIYAHKNWDDNFSTTEYVDLIAPLDREETVGEVSAKLEAISAKLQLQDVKGETIDDYYSYKYNAYMKWPFIVKQFFDFIGDDTSDERIIEYITLYEPCLIYDENEGLIWGKENYEKHLKYLDYIANKKASKKEKKNPEE